MRYFGYGSNLCGSDLADWSRRRGLPAIELTAERRAYLPDRRLAFTHHSTTRGGGVLDVPEAIGCAVLGVLFRPLSDAAASRLDRKESEGHVYRRFETVALTEDGGETPAYAYEVVPEHRAPFVTPAPAYLAVVRHGYREHAIPEAPLHAAATGEAHPGAVSRLFVYGTLMRGEERHPALMRHVASGGEPATAEGTLLDLGPYPGLVTDGSARKIAGELYDAPDPAALFADLDAIETFHGFGAPDSLYRRAVLTVTAAGVSVPAWTYLFVGPREGVRAIACGDWRSRCAT